LAIREHIINGSNASKRRDERDQTKASGKGVRMGMDEEAQELEQGGCRLRARNKEAAQSARANRKVPKQTVSDKDRAKLGEMEGRETQ